MDITKNAGNKPSGCGKLDLTTVLDELSFSKDFTKQNHV